MFNDHDRMMSGPSSLAERLHGFQMPLANPISCDRWLARSLLHKACRRGLVNLAWRALATLLNEVPDSIWRSLTIITLEDVGASGTGVLADIATAGRDVRWRRSVGGDWKVASFLVKRICEADHDQAVCDLFHHAVGSPRLAAARVEALDATIGDLIARLSDCRSGLVERAVLALAIGGGLAEGQQHRDAHLVLELLAEQGSSPRIIEVCKGAWRISRCPLALLMPLVVEKWKRTNSYLIVDDALPPVSFVDDLPGYAIDQFTRSGIQVARQLLTSDPELKRLLDDAAIARSSQHRTVGDLLFMIEGGALSCRVVWPVGDELRLPHRCLADTMGLAFALPDALERVAAQGPLIANLRSASLPSSSNTHA